jgi:hypothetical protein
MRISVERIVAAPLDVTFATALDIARWPQFISAITSVDVLTPRPIAVGSRFRETRQTYGRAESQEMTVTVLDPPRSFTLAAEAHGARYRAEHRFEQAAGGSRITVVFEGLPVTLLARLLSPLALVMAGSVRRQLAGDLADLAHEAERRSGQPPEGPQRI